MGRRRPRRILPEYSVTRHSNHSGSVGEVSQDRTLMMYDFQEIRAHIPVLFTFVILRNCMEVVSLVAKDYNDK